LLFKAFLLSGLFNFTCLTYLEGDSTSKWLNVEAAAVAEWDKERVAVDKSNDGRSMVATVRLAHLRGGRSSFMLFWWQRPQ